MIKTNLLPPEMQKRRARAKRPKGQKVSTGGGGGSSYALALTLALVVGVLAVGGTGYWMWGQMKAAEKQKRVAEKARDDAQERYQTEYEKYKQEYEKWNLLQDKLEILEVLMPEDRLLWSEKVNMFAALTPKGVYLTQLQVTEKITMRETKRSKEAREEWDRLKAEQDKAEKNKTGGPKTPLGRKPEVVNKPIITQTLVINGVAPWDPAGGNWHMRKVIEFQESLRTYEVTNDKGEVRRFSDYFRTPENSTNLEIVPGVMEKKQMNGVDVWTFQLTIHSKPFFDPNA